MAVRAALLTSRNINLDSDFSKYIETVSDPGVITGFEVTASAVGIGKAWVLCERTNGETIYTFVQNFNTIAISGNGYVIISIPQNIVDNGGGNEDGTGIASIEVVNELPAKNYLLLATITGGVVEDNRNMIHTVGELKTDIDSIFTAIGDLDDRVTALEVKSSIDHLEEILFVGEKYNTTGTNFFKQGTPLYNDATIDINVGDVAANTEIHIQRLGSGTASNKLKLKLKMAGSPTTSVKVEVRKGIQVDVSNNEAYWYGDSNNIIATGSLSYSSFSSSWQDVQFTLDNNFGGTEGELLDIVVYQTAGSGAVVNSSNYYKIACDSTQRSECFSYVSVNGNTRVRERLAPYCVSSSFKSALLAKIQTYTVDILNADKYYQVDTWNSYSDYSIPNWLSRLNNGTVYSGSAVFTVSLKSGESASSSFRPILKYGDNEATTSSSSSASFTVTNFDSSVAYQTKYYATGTASSINEPTKITLYYNAKKGHNRKKIGINQNKTIGAKITGYLFGMYNGTRRNGN